MEPHDPLRSAVDAHWRLLMIVGAVLVSVFAVFSPVIGVIWAALLLGFGVGLMFRSSRQRAPHQLELAHGGDGLHRVLVIANETVAGRSLLTQIHERCGNGRGEVLIVAPALTASRAQIWASDFDTAMEEARQRLRCSLRAAAEAGLRARGQVGDPDPNVALEDALRDFAADEVVVWTHTPDRSPWLEHGVVQRAREEVGLPLTHVVVDPGEEGASGNAEAP